MENMDWNEIQKYYDNNNSWKDIMLKFKISNYSLNKAVKNGFIKMRTRSESNKLRHIKNPQKHSEETKKKISDSRKKYLLENPDKVPYLLNHNSKKETYPEIYFDEIFSKNFEKEIDYKPYHQVGIYEIDFAFIKKGIALEIDGSQHYYDKKIIESDLRKNEYLENNGWKIFRVCWSDYQKFDKKEKEKFITNLINFINNKNEKPTLLKIDNKHYCIDCGKIVERRSQRCNKCDGKRKTLELLKRIPNYESLKNDVEKNGYSATGRKYKVSDNTIKKWIIAHKKFIK